MSLQQIILDDALGYWQKGYPSYTMILVMPAEIQTALVSFRRIYLTTLLSRRCPEHGQGDRKKKLYILHTHTHIYTHTPNIMVARMSVEGNILILHTSSHKSVFYSIRKTDEVFVLFTGRLLQHSNRFWRL